MKASTILRIGDTIRRLRESKGWTQKQLSEESGVHEVQIRRYENNQAIPRDAQLLKIANALGCQISDIKESIYINRKVPYFANGLKKLRAEHGLTSKELAKELNVSKENIDNWENGNREPYLHTVEKIADYFGTSLLYLCYGNEKHKKGIDANDKEAMAQEKAIRSAPRIFAKNEIDYPLPYEFDSPERTSPKFTAPSRSHAQTEAYDLFHSLLSEDWAMTQEQEITAVQLRKMLGAYNSLNNAGRREAVKRVDELTEIPRYTAPDPDDAPQD